MQVRGQHSERAADFLVKELKVCSAKEASERIFFISAKEVLQARLQEQKGLPAHSEYSQWFTTGFFTVISIPVEFQELNNLLRPFSIILCSN